MYRSSEITIPTFLAGYAYRGNMKANILIIDDEESIRFSFQRFLVADGHHVVTAGSYLEALSRMDEMQFTLIIADIILDDGWGTDILQEVARRNLKTRVIIMSAFFTPEVVTAGFHMQDVAYLTKPLRQESLISSVTEILRPF